MSAKKQTFTRNYTDGPLERDAKLYALFMWLLYGCVFFAGGYILSENILISLGFAAIFSPYAAKESKITYERNQIAKTERQFTDFFQLVLASVSAGRSIDQAFIELAGNKSKEFKRQFNLILPKIELICKRVEMNYSFYDEFYEFALSTKSRDIQSTAHALRIVGVKGGNLSAILRNSLSVMRVKIETDREIKQTLSLPKYNHKIITVMPFLLVLMIKLISKDYIEVLYTTKTGILVVCGVCGVLFLAWILGSKLVVNEW